MTTGKEPLERCTWQPTRISRPAVTSEKPGSVGITGFHSAPQADLQLGAKLEPDLPTPDLPPCPPAPWRGRAGVAHLEWFGRDQSGQRRPCPRDIQCPLPYAFKHNASQRTTGMAGAAVHKNTMQVTHQRTHMATEISKSNLRTNTAFRLVDFSSIAALQQANGSTAQRTATPMSRNTEHWQVRI